MKKKLLFITACFTLFSVFSFTINKRIGNRLKISLQIPQFKQSDLLDAVQAGDKKQVKQIFGQHYKNLDKKTINEAFVKTVTGNKKGLKPEISLFFLQHSKIKKKITNESLDKAFIKSSYETLYNLFLAIMQNPLFRKKLYTHESTKGSFEKALKYISKRKKYFFEFLSYQDSYEKIQSLDFITKKDLEAALEYKKKTQKEANRSNKERALFRAVEENDSKKVSSILDKHHLDLSKNAINAAFFKTVTGCKKYLKPKLAVLFLNHPKIKHKINGKSLDKAFINSIRHFLPNLFSIILQNSLFRNKLYTDNSTKEAFENVLKYASRYRLKLLYDFLLYPNLYKKVQYLDFITHDDLDAAFDYKKRTQEIGVRSHEEQALLKAVKKNDLQKVSNILNQNHQNIRKNVINELFIKTVTGRKKNLKPKITLLFLQHPEVKKKLHGESLDKAFIKSVQGHLKSLSLAILKDTVFRSKLYTHKLTQESFEKILKYMSKYSKKLLYKFLSYPDLQAKVQHLDFVPTERFTTKIPNSPVHHKDDFEKQSFLNKTEQLENVQESFNPFELLSESETPLFHIDFDLPEPQELVAEESKSLFDNLMQTVQEQNIDLLRNALKNKDFLSKEELKIAFTQAQENEWYNGMFEFLNLEVIDEDFFIT